jgi:hypothetical protein
MATYTELSSIVSFNRALEMHALLDYKADLEQLQQEEMERAQEISNRNGST